MPNSGRSSTLLLAASLAAVAGGVLLLWPPAERIADSTASKPTVPPNGASPAPVNRHDFGKTLFRPNVTLEHVFTFRNDAAVPVELQGMQGFPSCCVSLEPAGTVAKTLKPGDSFAIRMRIRPSKAERVTWRGAVTTSSPAKPFVAEATAELVPALSAAWEDDRPIELDLGGSATRQGIVQFVGEGGPPALTVAASDAAVAAALGPLTDRGPLAGTKARVWQAPFSVTIMGQTAGRHTGAVQVAAKSGDVAAAPLQWTTRSDWTVEPKALVLAASERQGRFTVTPRRQTAAARPMVDAPPALPIAVQGTPGGFEVVVTRPAKPGKTLETFTLKLGGETIPLSVVLLQSNDAVGEAKP